MKQICTTASYAFSWLVLSFSLRDNLPTTSRIRWVLLDNKYYKYDNILELMQSESVKESWTGKLQYAFTDSHKNECQIPRHFLTRKRILPFLWWLPHTLHKKHNSKECVSRYEKTMNRGAKDLLRSSQRFSTHQSHLFCIISKTWILLNQKGIFIFRFCWGNREWDRVGCTVEWGGA